MHTQRSRLEHGSHGGASRSNGSPQHSRNIASGRSSTAWGTHHLSLAGARAGQIMQHATPRAAAAPQHGLRRRSAPAPGPPRPGSRPHAPAAAARQVRRAAGGRTRTQAGSSRNPAASRAPGLFPSLSQSRQPGTAAGRRRATPLQLLAAGCRRSLRTCRTGPRHVDLRTGGQCTRSRRQQKGGLLVSSPATSCSRDELVRLVGLDNQTVKTLHPRPSMWCHEDC